MTRILLLGRNGQLGWELQRSLAVLGDVVALERHSQEHVGDLSRPEALRETVRAVAPDVIVNAAAYTAVDRAESEVELARTINAVAPEVLAQEAQKRGAWLVHFSTDYVFDGTGEAAWREDDAPAPLSVYGQTKLEGEQRIAQVCERHLVFRTSWVYGVHGQNFLKTMLKLGRERELLTVVADQIGAPTGAELLADATAHALRQALNAPEKAGLYHLTASGSTSWFEYARQVLACAQTLQPKVPVAEVNPIGTADYPTAARRPLNSRLESRRLEQAFGLHLPPWQAGVERAVQELLKA